LVEVLGNRIGRLGRLGGWFRIGSPGGSARRGGTNSHLFLGGYVVKGGSGNGMRFGGRRKGLFALAADLARGYLRGGVLEGSLIGLAVFFDVFRISAGSLNIVIPGSTALSLAELVPAAVVVAVVGSVVP